MDWLRGGDPLREGGLETEEGGGLEAGVTLYGKGGGRRRSVKNAVSAKRSATSSTKLLKCVAQMQRVCDQLGAQYLLQYLK